MKSQLVQIILYSIFAGSFFAVRRGGPRPAMYKRAARYAGAMIGLAVVIGWLMLLTG